MCDYINSYSYMTKQQLRLIIRECISEVNGEVNEGAISVQDTTNRVMVVMKDILKNLSKQIRVMNQKVPLSGEEVGKYVRGINDSIESKIVVTKIVPCNIEFAVMKEETVGGYSPKNKEIYLNVFYYLIKKHIGGSGYVLTEYKDIKFNDMAHTIEHELIHQQQDERSRGKIFGNKGVEKKLSSMYGDVINDKSEIAPEMSDDQFIEYVKYYNDPSELNTFAKNVVDKYVISALKDMRAFIRHGGLPSKNYYSAEEVRSFVLSPLLHQSKTDIFKGVNEQYSQGTYNINRFKQRLINLYDGYKYLSAISKKKWWIYVYQLLMNMKFDPLIMNK